MKIKTKSIITLCLTALASMPLSAQSYLGSVVDIEGTWTTAKNIKGLRCGSPWIAHQAC